MSVLSDEIKALVEMLEHNAVVQRNLLKIADALRTRATSHDKSKFSLEEFEDFVELKKISRIHAYGSQEYDDSMKDNKALDLHFERSAHHPEHYAGGVADMSLLDIVEMVCDWKAVNLTKRYNPSTRSWEELLVIQTKRFKLTDRQQWLIKLIAEELDQ